MINPINYTDKYFHYARTVALNHEELGENLARILKKIFQINITGKE